MVLGNPGQGFKQLEGRVLHLFRLTVLGAICSNLAQRGRHGDQPVRSPLNSLLRRRHSLLGVIEDLLGIYQLSPNLNDGKEFGGDPLTNKATGNVKQRFSGSGDMGNEAPRQRATVYLSLVPRSIQSRLLILSLQVGPCKTLRNYYEVFKSLAGRYNNQGLVKNR